MASTDSTRNVTLARVLDEREDLLVELAATKEFAIDTLREHLAARPRRTLLSNVADNVGSLVLEQSKNQAPYQYFMWLRGAARALGLRGIGDLVEGLAPFNSQKAISNINNYRPNGTYGHGLVARNGRDPWREIRVKTVRTVLARADTLVAKVQRRFAGRPYREVLDYIETRVLGSPSALNVTELMQPTARIVAVALSTNVKHVGVYEKMWGATKIGTTSALDELYAHTSDGGLGEQPLVASPGSWANMIDTISKTIISSQIDGVPVLLAINAPLGWPVAMTEVLAKHEAGAAIPDLDINVDADSEDRRSGHELNFGYTETVDEERWRHERNRFFRRWTEQIVRDVGARLGQAFGPSGLDVGADKSARTAHQALRLLSAVRTRTKLPIPVIVDRCGPIVRTSAIEVSTFWPRTSAGKADDRKIAARVEKYDGSYHGALSAAGHALAFLEGGIACPIDHGVDEDVARREGWIWYSRELGERWSPEQHDPPVASSARTRRLGLHPDDRQPPAGLRPRSRRTRP